MDIQRPVDKRARRIRRLVYTIVGVGAILLITAGLSRLRPAAPTVERATVMIDVVRRGSMLRQVRGVGTLVPEEIRWIPAATEGRVERIRLLPGAVVTADTVVLEMSNPELELNALDAEWQLKAAEAEYKSLQAQLETQLLDQKAAAAVIQADYRQAVLQAETDEELAKNGLAPDLIRKLSKVKAEGLTTRYEIEQQRLAINTRAIQAQLDAKRAHVEQLRTLHGLRRRQVESLRVRAGTEGVLQQVPVEVGQWVTPGLNLARVVEPEHLKAEIKVAETQAKDILIGQHASIDTRNGLVPGRVARIDPAAQNGTVTVDIALEGPLPKGARPDQSVDGTIELERLADILYVGRPVYGQGQGMVGLFKLEDDGKTAVRVQVRLGRSSVNTVEILDGLRVGDQVILSDMSAWDAVDRIRLK
ncbi:MAG: HlyD family efflux transporter periplasmic adaptor subunit [Candidatus Latescibacteria bacterium]|nr:HlyD family efflux transporter periplasmic adaptor subunit [Candidatus Latescibacterota bacterium]